jgi:mycothiol synthase
MDVTVEHAPSIPGLSFRMYRDETDLPALMQICWQIDSSPERGWTPSSENFEAGEDGDDPQPARDVLIAAIDEVPIGFTWLTRWTERPNLRVYLHRGFIAPAWQRRGIGRALLRWQEAHSIELIESDAHEGPFVFGGNADENQPGNRALLLAEGYAVAFTNVWMERSNLLDLPEAPLPEGIEWRAVVRAENCSILAELSNILWDVDEEYPDSENCDLSLSCVAWAGDKIAGIAIHHVEDATARTPWLAVMPEYRRRGIGKALLVEGLRRMRERGASRAVIFTNLDNPDRPVKLYESVGYRITQRLPRYRKPARIPIAMKQETAHG